MYARCCSETSHAKHKVDLQVCKISTHVPPYTRDMIWKACLLKALLQIIKGALRHIDFKRFWKCHAFYYYVLRS